MGALSADPAKFTKDYCGLFTETGLMPKKKLAKFPVPMICCFLKIWLLTILRSLPFIHSADKFLKWASNLVAQVTPNSIIQPGTPMSAAHFTPGQYVDIRCTFFDIVPRGHWQRGFCVFPNNHVFSKTEWPHALLRFSEAAPWDAASRVWSNDGAFPADRTIF